MPPLGVLSSILPERSLLPALKQIVPPRLAPTPADRTILPASSASELVVSDMEPLSLPLAVPVLIAIFPLDDDDASPVWSDMSPDMGAFLVVIKRDPDCSSEDSPME